MELKTEKVNEVLVVHVSGRLTANSAEDFKTYLEQYIQDGVKILFDLSQMEYIDSTGLGAMVSSLQKINEKNGVLKLSQLQTKPRVVFDITKAYKIFDIFDDNAGAIKAMEK